MRIRSFVAVLALSTLAAAPALAGEHCTAGAQDCLNKMASYYESSGWAGLEGDWNEEKGTWTVTVVVADSPAAAAGVQVGDVLYGINGHRFGQMTEAEQAEVKQAKRAGNTVTYMAKRAGQKMEVAIELGAMPAELVAQKVGSHMLEHAQVASLQ